jgi:hypothetical protein
MTVTELRTLLDRLEKEWDADMVLMLGPFGAQPVLVDAYDHLNHGYKGLAPVNEVVSDLSLGIVLAHDPKKGT